MDELQYHNDLLRAQNNQLNNKVRVLDEVIGASKNALFFYSFKDDSFDFTGSWNRMFPGINPKSWEEIGQVENMVDEEYREEFSDLIHARTLEGDAAEIHVTTGNGKKYYICNIRLFYDDDKLWFRVLKFTDQTAIIEKNRELHTLAYFDPLTGLSNRNSFLMKLTQWIDRAAAENTIISVAHININDFRQINDGIGVMMGDELLMAFGHYLKGLMGDEDHYICAHINADIFCMAIYDPMGERSMERICRTIHDDLMTTPFDLSGEKVFITVRMGVAEYPEAGESALELFERAEIVMFKVGRGDESWVRYFDAEAINEFVRSTKTEQSLKAANFDKELLLYYQPQYSTRTGGLRGAEALIRWRDSNGRLIPPGLFIPVAERSSLIVDIGEWVLATAVKTLSSWQQKYGTHVTISINISALHFAKDDFVDSVLATLERYDVSPSSLELEITETTVVKDFERITEKLRILKNHGIQAALDDFGTGYSSFSYLRNIPLKIIKIDKSFIDAMLEDDAGNVIVGSIVEMMNRLGYETVAEGVEENEQYDFLKEIGCTYIQGYLLGKPMPEDEFEALLEEQVWE